MTRIGLGDKVVSQANERNRMVTCLDSGLADCAGAIEHRMPLTTTGRSFARCDKHWSERLDKQREIDERYPDSPIPPADFDPAYAGEHWDYDY